MVKNTYQMAAGGLQATGHTQEAGRESTGKNRSLPTLPRPPAAVPPSSVVSTSQQQAPPLPAERQSPPLLVPTGPQRSSGAAWQVSRERNGPDGVGTPNDSYDVAGQGQGMGGGVASLGGEGTPSQSPATYMKVVLDPQKDGEEEELYEDMDKEGSYLTADQINSNFNVDMNDAHTMANTVQS